MSFVHGTGLTRRLRTQFANVHTVLEDENDPEAEGTNVVLGTSSNRVDRLQFVYITAQTVGMQHAVILRASDCPTDSRKEFPHRPEFGKDDAPLLVLI